MIHIQTNYDFDNASSQINHGRDYDWNFAPLELFKLSFNKNTVPRIIFTPFRNDQCTTSQYKNGYHSEYENVFLYLDSSRTNTLKRKKMACNFSWKYVRMTWIFEEFYVDLNVISRVELRNRNFLRQVKYLTTYNTFILAFTGKYFTRKKQKDIFELTSLNTLIYKIMKFYWRCEYKIAFIRQWVFWVTTHSNEFFGPAKWRP